VRELFVSPEDHVLEVRTTYRAMTEFKKPTPAELRAAEGKTVPDLAAPGLKVLFCGINPGLYSAATGHHFARPGNRFWPALYAGGFTDRLLSPFEERELLRYGCGIINFVERATAAADELSRQEFVEGAQRLRKKVLRYEPRILACLGVGAYRTGFDRKKATIGEQPESIGQTRLWVLPNPSGLNANYQSADLARLFRQLREAAEAIQERPLLSNLDRRGSLRSGP
jgi:TDG/mug DNA glycosylase family protein